jgi:hypothetical protein
VRISLLRDVDNAHAWLTQHPAVISVKRLSLHGQLRPGHGEFPTLNVVIDGDSSTVSNLLTNMVTAGFPVLTYQMETDNLEYLFLQLTRENTDV